MAAIASHVQTSRLLTYERQQGAGHEVVFVHGFPQTGHQWRHQMDALAGEGFACFAPDSRGFGDTEKPMARVSRTMLADDLIAYLDARGIDTCTLVGHDWGGIIAFKAAIDHPDRITRLALLDTLCTVWSPAGHHGYWFKAEGVPEQFFADHHDLFIRMLFEGADTGPLGGHPQNPWRIPPGARPRPAWIDDEALAHYRRAFADPDAWWHAISYYRYGLPFHIVHPSADGRERFTSLSEREVGAMWLGGLENDPRYAEFMDYGPDDRHKRYPHPVLWLYGSYRAGDVRQGDDRIPSVNPFFQQFSRYFPDLRARAVDAGHFLGEEAPGYVNQCLLAFLRGLL